MEHYLGGPCAARSVACCVVTGGGSVGWTVVPNGGVAAALELAFGRAAVRSAAQGGLVAGQAVEVVGLQSRPDLNGAKGLTLKFDEASGRWLVKLVDGDGRKSLKPANLILAGGSGGVAAEDTAGGPTSGGEALGGPTVLVFWGDAQWSRVQVRYTQSSTFGASPPSF